MGSWLSIIEEIKTIHHPEGGDIPIKTIETSVKQSILLALCGIEPPARVCTSPNASIVMEWYYDFGYLSVEINDDSAEVSYLNKEQAEVKSRLDILAAEVKRDEEVMLRIVKKLTEKIK